LGVFAALSEYCLITTRLWQNEKKLASNYWQNQTFVTVIPQESPKAWGRALGDIERG
jgi:hypothetical protein